jgi:hypothetical protein
MMVEKKILITYNVYKYDFVGISIYMRFTFFVYNELRYIDGKLVWTNSQEIKHIPYNYLNYSKT